MTLPVAGAVSALAATSDAPAARNAAKAASGWTALLGAAGTGFHLYGLHRRYGGYRRGSFLFNWLNGPPAPAPLQMIGLGLAGLAAERAGSQRVLLSWATYQWLIMPWLAPTMAENVSPASLATAHVVFALGFAAWWIPRSRARQV